MNEKQRLESQQVVQADNKVKKEEKDYSKYFERTYTPPSLKDARRRGKEEVQF